MEKLMLYAGNPRCKKCGKASPTLKVIDGVPHFAPWKEGSNPLRHQHLAIRLTEEEAQEHGFATMDIPPGMATTPLKEKARAGGIYGLLWLLREWRRRRTVRAELAV